MANEQVQEIELKKKSLRRYRRNQACLNRLEEKLYFLDQKINSIKSPSYSGMPRGGTPKTLADYLGDKDELESRIDKLSKKGRRIKSEILAEFDELDDDRYIDVLEAYFIEGRSIADIAEENGYSERYVYNLYRAGVAELVLRDTTQKVQ